LKNTELIDYIKKSASHYSAPDSFTGYGIPDFKRASDLIMFAANLSNMADNSPMYLYPNPVSGEVNLVIPKKYAGKSANIRLYDLPGKLIYQENLIISSQVNGLLLDTSNLNEGMYLLKVMIDGKIFTLKLLK
jgi:serine protease AprX